MRVKTSLKFLDEYNNFHYVFLKHTNKFSSKLDSDKSSDESNFELKKENTTLSKRSLSTKYSKKIENILFNQYLDNVFEGTKITKKNSRNVLLRKNTIYTNNSFISKSLNKTLDLNLPNFPDYKSKVRKDGKKKLEKLKFVKENFFKKGALKKVIKFYLRLF